MNMPSPLKRKKIKGRQNPSAHIDGPQSMPSTASSSAVVDYSSEVELNNLITELSDSVEQGRIFDARKVVHQLEKIEKSNYAALTAYGEEQIQRILHPIRPVIQEVLAQSSHVESLLHDLHSNDNWILAKERSGVIIHYRREENSPIHVVRAQAVFKNFEPIDFVRLCSLFVETELMPKWFPGGIMKKANVLSWHSKYSKVIQMHISLGLLPLTSPRDAIVYGNGYHLPDRNAFLISSKSIVDESSCRYCQIPKPEKGVVRMTTESIFFIQLVERNVISFKLIGRDDLKFRFMPSALLNYIAQGHMPFDLTRTIRYKIRNFEGSPWEEMIRERGEYYREIQDKIHEQLDVWEKEGNRGRIATRLVNGVKSIRKSVTFEDLQSAKGENGYINARIEDENEGKMSTNTGKLSTMARTIIFATVAAVGFYFYLGFESPFRKKMHSVLSLLSDLSSTRLVVSAFLPVAVVIGMRAMSRRQIRESHDIRSSMEIETYNRNNPSKPPQKSLSEIITPSKTTSMPQSSLKPRTLFPANENNDDTGITANRELSPSTIASTTTSPSTASASKTHTPSPPAPQAPKNTSPRIPPMKKVGSLLSSAPKSVKKAMPSAKSIRNLRPTSGTKN